MAAIEDRTSSARVTLGAVSEVYWMLTTVGMPGGHEAHFHPETIEVCYVRRGRLDWWIGNSSYEVHSGDVLVMRPGEPHGSVDSTLQPCEYFAVHLKPEALSSGAQSAIEDAGFGGHYSGQSETGELVRRIYDEHQKEGRFREEVCGSLVNLLVVSLARHGAVSAASEPENYLVRRAIQAFSMDSGISKSVEQVAQELRVSTVWLTRVFRNELGQSPGEWIRSRKMTEAKRRLASGRGTVIEIALELGFTSSQYFATAFRRDTGLSPTDYRRRCAGAVSSRRRPQRAA